MAKRQKTRFGWHRKASEGTAEKFDRKTEETILIQGRDFPQEIQDEMFVYGISKIIDDRQSQVAADDKMEGIPALVTQFMEGTWKSIRTGGIHLLPIVIEAIMEVKDWKVAKAQSAYRKLDEEQRVVLKDNLKDEMLAIAAARKLDEGDEEDFGDLLT